MNKRQRIDFCEVKEEVLDLSKRRDSVETRNTPSPYNTSKSNEDSPTSQSPDREMQKYSPFQPSSLPYPIPYPALARISAHHAQLEFNQSLNRTVSPIRDTSESPPQNLPISSQFPYPGASIAPYLLQPTTTLQHELQQRLIANKDLQAVFNQKPLPSIQADSNVQTPLLPQVNGKVVRPFKLYSQDPHSLNIGFIDEESRKRFYEYKSKAMSRINEERYDSKSKRKEFSQNECSSDSCSETGTPATSTTPNSSTDVIQANSPSGNNNNNNTITSNNNNNNKEKKDDAYYERRRKNNAAAKKSRDRRRMKEDEIAIRAGFLQQENIELKYEVACLKKQLAFLTKSIPTTS